MPDTTRDIVLRLEGTVNQIMGMVTRLDKTINGNGTPGLKADVQDLRGRMESVEERHCGEDEKAEQKETRSWDVRKGVILLVIGQVITLGGLVLAVWLGLK